MGFLKRKHGAKYFTKCYDFCDPEYCCVIVYIVRNWTILYGLVSELFFIDVTVVILHCPHIGLFVLVASKALID